MYLLSLHTFIILVASASQASCRIYLTQNSERNDECNDVCQDLPPGDKEPVCMMFSRYKKGYQFFVNECHARRTICMNNLILHMVHPSRCMKSKQFFMPVS